MLERFLLLWLCLISLAAYYWPTLGLPIDIFISTKSGLNYIFGVAMFSIGWLLPRDELREISRRWHHVIAGTMIQYTVMPALAFAMTRLFNLSDDLSLGMILVGCVPGAMASNVLTLAARGNVSYSICLTTSATLLSPLLVPATLYLTAGTLVHVPVLNTFWLLCTTVVLPVVVGHMLSRSFPAFTLHIQPWAKVLANLAILWIIAVVVAINREKIPTLTSYLLLALLLTNLLGYAAGYVGGSALRLPDTMRRALTLEVGLQNAGLGSVLVTQLFPDRPEAALPTALYTFGCVLTGTILAQLWILRDSAKERE